MFYPNMYKRNIFDINYELLKEKGVKLLAFDLDNTLVLIDQENPSKELISLITKLKKDFIIVINSNNKEKRVSVHGTNLDCDYVAKSLKPTTHGLKKIKKKYNLKNNEICVIGDQLITDIYSGNKFKSYTVLVNPLGKKDLKITSFNRFLENIVFKHYKRKNIMERNKYYE